MEKKEEKAISKGVKIMNEDSKNSITGKIKRPTAGGGMTIREWWPNQLNLDILHQQSSKSNPMDEDCLLYTSPSPRDRS